MPTESVVAEVRVNKLAANVVGLLFTGLLCFAGVLVVHLLPHYIPFSPQHFLYVSLAFILLLPVHEALHAVGLRSFAKAPWRDIKFGIFWKALMTYCHCKVPIRVAAYRRMALLPLQVTGIGSLLVLLAFPTDMTGVFAGLTIAACVGDVWIVARMRPFADDVLVLDSATEIGCDILLPLVNTDGSQR